MKYVILKRQDGSRIPIIFPNELVHKHVTEAILNHMGLTYGITEVVSAGSLNSQSMLIDQGSLSNSLDLAPDPDDQDTIFMNDYMHGQSSLPQVKDVTPTPESWERTEQVITGDPEERCWCGMNKSFCRHGMAFRKDKL